MNYLISFSVKGKLSNGFGHMTTTTSEPITVANFPFVHERVAEDAGFKKDDVVIIAISPLAEDE